MNASVLVLQRPAFDAIVLCGMLMLAGLMSWAWLSVLRKTSTSAYLCCAAAFAAILLANLGGDALGLFMRTDLQPPPFVILVSLSIGLGVAVGLGFLGGVGDSLVRGMQVETLVALQIFRLPLELLMLRAAYLGIMPMEFSLIGYNFDVLTGLGALLISIYCAWTWALPLRVVWAWNVLGIACLVAIILLAAATSPNVHAFGMDAKHINSWVLYFPYSLLPTFLVSFAVFGHVLLTRKLLLQRNLAPLLGKSAKLPQAGDAW